MTDHDTTTLVDRYLASWNETDPSRRRQLVVATWSDDAYYVDPRAEVRGHDGVDGLLGAVQEAWPGCLFEREGEVDEHHDRVRFTEVSGFLLGVDSAAA